MFATPILIIKITSKLIYHFDGLSRCINVLLEKKVAPKNPSSLKDVEGDL